MSLIIFSKIRKAILTLLFLNEDKEFYVREIARLIHYSSSGVQKELAHLENEDILISKNRGKLKLFEVNKNDPSYLELKNIIIKSAGLKFYLEKSLNNFSKINQAFIYGSWASGEADSFSDIDLFLIGNAPYDKLNGEITKLEEVFRREINFQLVTKKEFEDKKKIKDTFIINLLENPKIFIKGGISEL
jgi:predicted nucleotidyltransferase